MSVRTKRAIIRGLRVFAAVVIAGIVAKYGDSQYYLIIAPVLTMIDKWVRE